MAELLVVIALLALVIAAAALSAWMTWGWLVWGGLILIVIGLSFGVPTGLVYHLRLRRALIEQDALAPRWWLRPNHYHDDIDPARRSWVMRPFYAGAIGFGVILLGCGMALVGQLHSPW